MHVYTFVARIYPPTTCFYHLPLPTGTNPPPWGRTCSALLLSDFVAEKRKNSDIFCLFEIKVATQGVSLFYFHVYIYYNPSRFIASNFLHSSLVSFL
jgi:hypothetical protein